MSGNITRAEAAERSHLISVESYEIELDLTGATAEPPKDGPLTFRSQTRLVFTSSRTGEGTWVDLIAPHIRRITLNGRVIDAAKSFDGERIHLTTTETTNELVVDADCAFMTTGEGLHRFVDPVDDEVYLYSQFEIADARRVFACFDQPDMKATFQLDVEAPDHWHVVSNTAAPTEQQEIAPGRAHWSFARTPVMSTYITAIVAGPYSRIQDSYEGVGGTIPLGIFCRSSLAQYLDPDEIFAVTKQGFAFFEELFDMAYPFGKYDQLFVPEFNAGAMENAGCVTFHEGYVFRSRVTRAAYESRANTILHEMAHMWFGDLVTMKWWDDLWLNESFAEWASHHASVQATQYTDAWTSFAIGRKAWAYRQDQLPSTHPIAADMVDLDAVQANFDGITYAKGASALKQLVAWVGLDNFITGLRHYFAEHAWGNTELSDLLRHLEQASGRDLHAWTQQWLQTSGVNGLSAEIDVDERGAIAQVAVLQTPPATPPGLPPTLRSHRVRIGLFSATAAGMERQAQVEVDVTGERTVVSELTGKTAPDILLLNDDDLTFAKIRLAPRSAAAAVSYVGTLTDPLARTLLWGAAWDMTRDAEMSTGDLVSMVLQGLPGETEIAVIQTVLRQVHTALDAYATPEHRQTYRKQIAQALWNRAEQAEGGSDRQLTLVRSFTSMAASEGNLDLVAGLLDGSEVLPGLAVDTDLRWRLLRRLVTEGRAGMDAIEAESARDATASGDREKAAAVAALPTEHAKEAAWRSVVVEDSLPNALRESTIAGFADADHLELLRPYRDRYFAALPLIWEQRTPETATSITMGLFPYLLVEEATLQAADAFLATDPHPTAARYVSEGRDTVARSLRARARDAR